MKNIIYKALGYIIKKFNKIIKPTKVGARVIIIQNGKILLLKHSDGNNRYFPGGGSKIGELPIDTAIREVSEETGINIYKSKLKLQGVYNNLYESKNDYIFIFMVDLSDAKNKIIFNIDNKEICESKFFEINNLPKTISPGTQRRILELDENKGDIIFKKW